MLDLLKRVLGAARLGKTAPEPAQTRVRLFPKRYDPIGTDEDGYPIYSREDMEELFGGILAERLEAVRLEAEERARRLAQERAELAAVVDTVTTELPAARRRRL
ncbi:hypothetical protein [Cupriavidus malaysiensis]|uniref:DivIVA domain-containing protein n=1 Tax=Cupriavidus malaysiensis TaxID=367825 RepID=A0ABM6F3C3_9BURK|nr:hypothetical protein [Cupriavidus malaysiensis]AOZ05889.1 hypothetical protein BKK80_08695 [Cupriavidus malaysiensis]